MLAAVRGAVIGKTIKSRTYYKPFFNASLTLLRNYDVVYIENSKVACTKIKKVLLTLDNWPLTADQILEKEVHIHNKERTGLIGPENLTWRGLSRVVSGEEFFKFGFVRNPYDRTLSAYSDKIYQPQKDPTKRNYVPLAQRIKANFVGGNPREINLDRNPVSFAEFVEFISQQKRYDMDRHWLDQHLTMWHPYVNFDFVGKLENFSNDFAYVLERIKAPAKLIEEASKKANATKRPRKKYYDQELARKVHDTFRKDFELYGYEGDSWTQF